MPQFTPFDYAGAVARGTQNAMAQMQAEAYPEQSRNAMRQSVIKQRLAGLDYIAKSAPMVTPDSYQAWKTNLESTGMAGPGELPDQYDPEIIGRLAKGAKQQKLMGGGINIGTYNPRDYTTKSWSEFVQTGDPSKLERYTQKTIDIAGVPHQLVPGRGYVPLSTLREEAGAAGELEKGKKIGGIAAGQIKTATEQIPKIQQNIENLNEVIRLVDKEGAETGPLAKHLPSFRAASIKLDNMRRRLGLDVIGSVTFGALSEAELKMALDTALPTGLEGPELISWAKNKQSAQQKLKNYLQDQVSFLSQPGNTIADWYEKNQQTQQEGRSLDQQAIDWARSNPNDPRAQQILQLHGM